MSNACRKSSIESWYTKLLGHEYNTDLNDTRKLCTGFRYIFEHSALLKIISHMEKQQKIQKNINEFSTNLCCFHVQCSLRLTITESIELKETLKALQSNCPVVMDIQSYIRLVILMQLRTGRWGEVHCASGFSKYFIKQSGLVG